MSSILAWLRFPAKGCQIIHSKLTFCWLKRLEKVYLCLGIFFTLPCISSINFVLWNFNPWDCHQYSYSLVALHDWHIDILIDAPLPLEAWLCICCAIISHINIEILLTTPWSCLVACCSNENDITERLKRIIQANASLHQEMSDSSPVKSLVIFGWLPALFES